MHRAIDREPASALGRILRASRPALAGVLWLACLRAGAQPPAGGESLVNSRAPEFARRSLGGQPIDLDHLRGNVVLLDFWATWCAPCLTEMPIFSQWQSKYGPEGFAVIGISMDDDAPPVRRLVARINPSYPIAMGDAHLGRLYGGVLGLPLLFLIDRRGVVRARYQGESDFSAIQKELNTLLDRR